MIGDAQKVYFVEHNTTTGMSDYRGAGPTLELRYIDMREVFVDLNVIAEAPPGEAYCQLPAVFGPERVANLANQARVRFHAAA